MARDGKGYSLMMNMSCESCRAPNIADMIGLIDKVNLMGFDFKSLSRSKLVVPNLPPLVIDWWGRLGGGGSAVR